MDQIFRRSFKLRADRPEELAVELWLQEQANASDAIRDALVQHVSGRGGSLVVVNDKLDEVLRVLRSGVALVAPEQNAPNSGAGDGLDDLDGMGL